jgi:hypothetical protein
MYLYLLPCSLMRAKGGRTSLNSLPTTVYYYVEAFVLPKWTRLDVIGTFISLLVLFIYLFFLLLSNKNGEKTGCAPFAWNMSVRSRPTKGNQKRNRKRNNKNNFKKKKKKNGNWKLTGKLDFPVLSGIGLGRNIFCFFYLLLWLFLSSSLFFYLFVQFL